MTRDIIREYIMKNTGMSELMCPELYEDLFSVYMHIYIEWQHMMYITYIAMVVLRIEKSLRVIDQTLFTDTDTFLTFDFKEYIMDKDKITEVQFKQKCVEVCSKWYKPNTMALLLREFKPDNGEEIGL